MEKIVNIITEIKNIQELNKQLDENTIIDSRNLKLVQRKYSNDKEGELLQNLDETKDYEKKIKLREEIKQLRAEKIDILETQLDLEVANTNKIMEDVKNKKFDTVDIKLVPQKIINIINKIKATQEDNEKIGEKRESYSNDAEGELLQELDETKDVYKRKELIEEIRKIKDEQINELYKELDSEVEIVNKKLLKISNRDFEDIMKKTTNNIVSNEDKQQQKEEENLAWEQKEKEEKEKIIKEENEAWVAYENNQFTNENETDEQPDEELENNDEEIQEIKDILNHAKEDEEIQEIKDILDQTKKEQDYKIERITIYPDKIETEPEIQLEEIEISEKLQNEVDSMKEKNIQFDEKIVEVLAIKEEQAQAYLMLCKQYNNYKSKDFIADELQIDENNLLNIPEINYNLQDLRKNRDLKQKEKMEIYNNAIHTRKIFKDIQNIDIKMSLFDKVYFKTADIFSKAANKISKLMQNFKSQKTLQALEKQGMLKAPEISKSWELTEEQEAALKDISIKPDEKPEDRANSEPEK